MFPASNMYCIINVRFLFGLIVFVSEILFLVITIFTPLNISHFFAYTYFFSARNKADLSDHLPPSSVPRPAGCRQPYRFQLGFPGLFWRSYVCRSYPCKGNYCLLLLLKMRQKCRAYFTPLGEYRVYLKPLNPSF